MTPQSAPAPSTSAFWLNFPNDDPGTPRMELGPDLDNVWLQRLLGTISGKVVLELGCGSGDRAVWLAQQGAKVIAVDPSADHIVAGRRLAEQQGVSVEFHHGDLAEIPFVRAERIDVALSVYALSRTPELGRVFRQVHRVLRQEAPLLISLPHPTALQCRVEGTAVGVVRRSDDPEPVRWQVAGQPNKGGSMIAHRTTDVFGALRSSNFRVDTVLEPMAAPLAPGTERSPYWSPLFDWVPSTLVIRGRKEGT